MSNAPKKIYQFQDPVLTFGGSLFVLVCISLCILMYSFINPYAEDAVIGQVWCISMIALFLICPVLCAKQWYSIVVLTQTAIHVKVPFSRSEISKYEAYPFIYIGQYHHGSIIGLRFVRKFLILSRTRISADILEKANLICSNNTQVKILLNRRNINFLMSVLPHKQRERFQDLLVK